MRRRLLAVVDALALLLFVVVGVLQHDGGVTPALALRNAVPLLASWFAVAAIVGTYARPGPRSMLATWAVGVPLGLLLRTLWVGSPEGSRILVFLGVGLAFTLLFLMVGRAVAGRSLRPDAASARPGVVR